MTRPFRPLLQSVNPPPRLGASARSGDRLAAIEIAAFTDRGRVRKRNEDAFAADAGLGLAVVADGMGGHPAGDVASRTAAEAVRAWRSGVSLLPSFLPSGPGSRSR